MFGGGPGLSAAKYNDDEDGAVLVMHIMVGNGVNFSKVRDIDNIDGADCVDSVYDIDSIDDFDGVHDVDSSVDDVERLTVFTT